MSSKATFAVAKKVIHEMTMLAGQEGIILTDHEVEKVTTTLLSFKKEATSSIHQDMRKGLPIEVENLHGGALR